MICFDDDVPAPPKVCGKISRKSDYKTLKCGHTYHRVCINKWLIESDKMGQGRSCPSCRQQVPVKAPKLCVRIMTLIRKIRTCDVMMFFMKFAFTCIVLLFVWIVLTALGALPVSWYLAVFGDG